MLVLSSKPSAEQLRVKAGKTDSLVRWQGHQGFCRSGIVREPQNNVARGFT
jgi:hypothetical protein